MPLHSTQRGKIQSSSYLSDISQSAGISTMLFSWLLGFIGPVPLPLWIRVTNSVQYHTTNILALCII